MLIKCPECELQVSDKAIFCPHCGFPLQKGTTTRISTRKTHTQRLPNGFGQITKISSKNLRNPYRVMVTIGKNEYGKPICKLLKPQAYFPTYNDAYAALVNYNKQPYDLSVRTSLQDLYEQYKESKKYNNLKEPTKKAYASMWNNCDMLANMEVTNIRLKHIRACIEAVDAVYVKKMLKTFLSVLFDFAIQYELVERNYAKEYQLEDSIVVQKEHISFTEDEISILWNSQSEYAEWVLFQCYTGLRPTELLELKLENINLDKMYIVGGKKTRAGTDRTIPIVSIIQEIAKKIYERSILRGSAYFISDSKHPCCTYHMYESKYKKLLKDLNLNEQHRLHDPRKHFITICKSAGVNDFAIKRIVGHAITDITEKLYTERSLDWLRSEIEKVV